MNSTYVGIGYVITQKEKDYFLNSVSDINRRLEISKCMYNFSTNPNKYFFGEIIADIPRGSAHSIESLAALPGLVDDGSFGYKYGMMLYDCGLPIEEVNKNWSRPTIYFVNTDD